MTGYNRIINLLRDTQFSIAIFRYIFQLTICYPIFSSSIPDAVIGSEVAQVTANDVDSGPPLWYVLSVDGFPGSAFSIFRYGGQIWLTEPLDYEERTSYTLTIQTSDGKHQSRADLRLLLQDVNDNAPEFRQSLYQVDITKSMTCIYIVDGDLLLHHHPLLMTSPFRDR